VCEYYSPVSESTVWTTCF